MNGTGGVGLNWPGVDARIVRLIVELTDNSSPASVPEGEKYANNQTQQTATDADYRSSTTESATTDADYHSSAEANTATVEKNRLEVVDRIANYFRLRLVNPQFQPPPILPAGINEVPPRINRRPRIFTAVGEISNERMLWGRNHCLMFGIEVRIDRMKFSNANDSRCELRLPTRARHDFWSLANIPNRKLLQVAN